MAHGVKTVLDSPHNFSDSTDGYTCQVIISWPHKAGFFGEKDPIEIPSTKAEQLGLMKRFSDDWKEPFRSLVHRLPDDVEIVPLRLEDWYPTQDSRGTGRLALIGDSAHTMTMCEYKFSLIFILLPGRMSATDRQANSSR